MRYSYVFYWLLVDNYNFLKIWFIKKEALAQSEFCKVLWILENFLEHPFYRTALDDCFCRILIYN